jgi:PAS domain S-box-containing protein
VAVGGAAGVLLAALLGWAVQSELVERRARAAEEALRESEQRLRATQEQAGVGIAEADAEGRLLRVNGTMSAITGRSRDELLGRILFDLTRPEDAAAARPEYRRLVAGEVGTYAREERCVGADGSERWVEVAAAAVRDPAGRFLYGVWVVQDVHERKLAESRQRLLSDELNHRVKNTLAVVRGIAARTLADDRPPAEARRVLADRLGALARAHEALAAGDWAGARLRGLLEGELRPFGARAALNGPDLALTPKAAQTLSLVLHELATNAAKHGALSTPEGRVEVAWGLEAAGPEAAPASAAGLELRLRWRERGGPPVAPPARRGFGRTLVEQDWRHELGGKVSLDFRPDGLACELAAPAAAVVAA